MRGWPAASRGRACTTWICSGGLAPLAAASSPRSSLSSATSIGLDEGIEPDAGAAVGEGARSAVSRTPGFFLISSASTGASLTRRLAAALAVGEIEQAAGDRLIDLLAGLQPDAGDKRFAAPGSCAPSASALRRVGCACASADAAGLRRRRCGTAGCASLKQAASWKSVT